MKAIIKTFIALSFSFFFTNTVNAQITFQKTFGGTNVDYAYSVQQNADDGYIIAGYTTSFGAGSRDVYLIRTDAKGTTLWTKTFGESDTDYAYTVQQTTDGGFIIGAHSGSFGAGSHDVYLIKCDANGEIVCWRKGWVVIFSQGFAQSIEQHRSVVITTSLRNSF